MTKAPKYCLHLVCLYVTNQDNLGRDVPPGNTNTCICSGLDCLTDMKHNYAVIYVGSHACLIRKKCLLRTLAELETVTQIMQRVLFRVKNDLWQEPIALALPHGASLHQLVDEFGSFFRSKTDNIISRDWAVCQKPASHSR